ncbi:hypothetical protein BD769DRAFT_1671242 [Suillus cothurnatus]|nr:hypothetical protein BD769DRAFT_1671242 [Suillus cothurnatus]
MYSSSSRLPSSRPLPASQAVPESRCLATLDSPLHPPDFRCLLLPSRACYCSLAPAALSLALSVLVHFKSSSASSPYMSPLHFVPTATLVHDLHSCTPLSRLQTSHMSSLVSPSRLCTYIDDLI